MAGIFVTAMEITAEALADENGAPGLELLHKTYSIDQLSRVLHKAIAWYDRV